MKIIIWWNLILKQRNFRTISKLDFEIFTFYEDEKSTIWTGMNGGGITTYNYQNETWNNFKNVPKNPKSLPS